jgi:hypothetical protein
MNKQIFKVSLEIDFISFIDFLNILVFKVLKNELMLLWCRVHCHVYHTCQPGCGKDSFLSSSTEDLFVFMISCLVSSGISLARKDGVVS